MDTTNEDEAQREARQKAAMLLRDRHERESEALAELLASIARRNAAAEIVERATVHIETRLAEMSRLGFGDTTLAELGVDVADIRGAGGSRTRERAFPEEWQATPPVDQGSWGNGDADRKTPGHSEVPVTPSNEHVAGVRTTASLASVHSPMGLTARPLSRVVGHVEPGTAPTR